jgi:hypothetical protein
MRSFIAFNRPVLVGIAAAAAGPVATAGGPGRTAAACSPRQNRGS